MLSMAYCRRGRLVADVEDLQDDHRDEPQHREQRQRHDAPADRQGAQWLQCFLTAAIVIAAGMRTSSTTAVQ